MCPVVIKKQTHLHFSTIWEVSSRNVVLQLDLRENHWQLVDQTLLFIILPEDRRHLLLQIADDVGMDLGLRKARTKVLTSECSDVKLSKII